ncbi:MAG: hypothetical protein K1X28_05570 [Parachlamydiales bacterium]|nr:hypothetical protein [Parachlamydiales bacterium]
MNGTEALGEAVSSLSDVTMSSEMTKAGGIVTMIQGVSLLSVAITSWWNYLSQQYAIAMFSSVTDPSYSAKAAAAYSAYSQAQQEGQFEMSQQDNVLSLDKGVLKQLGNAMDQTYSLMQAPMQLAKATSKAILILGS